MMKGIISNNIFGTTAASGTLAVMPGAVVFNWPNIVL